MVAKLERLKKRIKTLEEWVDKNEALGGPEGTMDTFNYLISRMRQAEQLQGHFNQLQQYLQMFLQEEELMDKWNDFIMEKENAIQEQTTEEIPTRETSESSEEVGKEDAKGSETSEESET